jgi:hypothetical protein
VMVAGSFHVPCSYPCGSRTELEHSLQLTRCPVFLGPSLSAMAHLRSPVVTGLREPNAPRTPNRCLLTAQIEAEALHFGP